VDATIENQGAQNMKIYAVTGAASGIGAAVKQQLVNEGHTVISIDIANADITADLASDEGREAAIGAVVAMASEGLNGLVACAGVGTHIENRALIPSVNYFGAIALIEGLRDLLACKTGAVVLISSNSAPMDTDANYVDALLAADETTARTLATEIQGQPAYSGSKQALTRWMRRNNAGYAAQGIRMNAIGPGYTRTAMTAAVEEDPLYGPAIKDFVATIPLQRPGQPEDIAQATSFLLGDNASFISGSMLFVDGGHDALFRPDKF
jgi:NAD(P)-dependent dehydrogenase (short-subunit alcohol dehydrogenase family)